MKPIHLGFIGCGEHAVRSHAKVVIDQPELFEITAVFDINPVAMKTITQLNRTAKIYNATSVKDLLEQEDVEAVVIATPPPFHLEAMQLAIIHKKHILCEKPLWDIAAKNKQGRDAVQRAESNGLVLTSCHPRRFEPEYIDVLQRLDGFVDCYGALKEIAFSFFYHKTSKAWRKEDSLLLDHMNHEIDMVNFLLGQNSVTLNKLSDTYDYYQVTGAREDGVNLIFSGSRRLTNKIYRNELKLTFDRGRVTVLIILKGGVINSTILKENFNTGKRIEQSKQERSVVIPFYGIMKNFALTIRGKAKNYLTPSEIIQNTIACTTLLKKEIFQS